MLQKKYSSGKAASSSRSKRDILPKLLSVAAALVLWIYVNNINTTVDEKVISGVPVVLENLDISKNNLDIVSGREHTIEVTVSGIKSDLEEISRDDIFVSADMNGIDTAGTYKVDLNITTPSGITVINKSTSEISVSVDRTTSRHVAVEVDLHSNDVDSSVIEIGEPVLSVSSVQVTGPQKIVDSIEKIKISLNVDLVKDSIDSKGCSFVAVDKNGNVVSSPYIKYNQSVVDVSIPVYKKADVEIIPVFSDDLNYIISYSDFSPKIVTVTGKAEAVESINCIFTETIDVAERSGNFNINLDLPEGITALDKNGSPIHSVRISGFVSEPVIIPSQDEMTINE